MPFLGMIILKVAESIEPAMQLAPLFICNSAAKTINEAQAAPSALSSILLALSFFNQREKKCQAVFLHF